MTQVSLIKGEHVDNNTDYRDSLAVNMYAIPRDILGARGYMINYYGLTDFAKGKGIDRGGKWVSRDGFQNHYRVSGDKFISISATGVVTELGTIPGTDQCSITYSFNNVAIVGNGKLYYYSPAKGFRLMTDVDIGSPIDIVWVDGIFFLTDGEDIYHSDALDEEVYLNVAFGNAQFVPDSSQGLGQNEDNEVIVFGSFSKENFMNVGTGAFQFQRIARKAQKIGILGTHCKKEMNSRWYILGRRLETSPSFHVLSIGEENNIGTRETDLILAKYTDDELSISTVDAFVDAHTKMVIFHLPRHTLMYNETIAETMQSNDSAWTILQEGYNDETIKPWRGRSFVRDKRNGKWLAGDKYDNSIGHIDESTCTNYGEICQWELFTPLLKLEALSVDFMEIETIPGIAPDSDATVSFSTTQNGRNYSQEYTKLYGETFDYNQRFIMRRLGYTRHWVGYKFKGSSRSRMSFAYLNIEAS
ncbi:MAG: packaged DNA stabilization protein [Nitrosomonadaceae bacterium]